MKEFKSLRKQGGWVQFIPLIAAGVSALGSVAGSVISSKASKKASAQQVAGGGEAQKENKRQFNKIRKDLQPYRSAGKYGVNKLRSFQFQPYEDFEFGQDPGYQFRLNQGEKSISRARSAGLLPGGGATLKALNRFNQDYASGEYGSSYNRYSGDRAYDFDMQGREYGRLADLAGSGLNAAGMGATAGTNFASMNNELMTGAANARAAGTIGSANAWNQGIGNAVNAGMDALTLRILMNGRNTNIPTSGTVLPGRRVLSSPNPYDYSGYA